MAKKVMQKLKEEVVKKGLKLSVTENGKEVKSKMIAPCGFLGALVVFLVGPDLIAFLGLWLDYQRRLRLIACSLLT